MSLKSKLLKLLFSVICAFVLFAISRNSITKYTAGDPQLTLLTSQSLLEHGSTNLYSYYKSVKPDDFADGTWKYSVWEKQKKVYYFYPLGTSIVCMPIVFIARLAGYDFIEKKDDALWQSIIASICVSVVFLLLLVLTSHYMSFYWAISVAFVTCLATSISSTVGVALWSFNFEIIFLLFAFIHISKVYTQPESIKGIRLGAFIFMAWFCRPSALLIFGLIAIWLFLVNKKEFKKYILTIAIFYLPFGIYAITHFNLVVPAYYHPLFWTHMAASDESFLSKFLAILFSPNRGLFLFTPALLLSFSALFIKEMRKNVLFILSFIWFIVHTLMLARQYNWWGGWSFGPRLFSDALIPLFIMFLLSFDKLKQPKARKALLILFFIFSIPGIYIHTIKGANDIATYKWNDNPAIDEHIDFYEWNMDYPQFCADSISNEKKKEEFELLKKLDKGILKLKKGDQILISNKSDLSCELKEKLNAKKEYEHVKLYCELNDLLQSPVDTFYIVPNLYDQFSNDTNYIIVPPKMSSLAAYIKVHQTNHIFISTKFDLFEKMSDETKMYFNSIGSHIFEMNNQQGIVMHLLNGKVMQELLTSKEHSSIEFTINGCKIKALSNGIKNASIKVNGKEYSINDGGFNVVCVNNDGIIVDVARFNTHFVDAEYLYLFSVIKKHN